MQRATGTVTTTNPSAIGTFDWTNRFRAQLWEDSPEEVRMQQPENDAQLITFMNRLPRASREWNNPTMRYSIDTRLEGDTTLTAQAGAADTTIYLADPYVVRAGYTIYLPESGQSWLVISVNDTAKTAVVDRTIFGGTAVIAKLGAKVIPGVPYMAELGEPVVGSSSTPGDPVYNFISMAGIYFAMSKMQVNSAMESDFGTLPKEMENTKYQLLQRMQSSMLFSNRTTWYDTSSLSQVYVGAGLIYQLQKHTLDLGTLGTQATWPNFNDFLEPMFDSSLSALKKDFFAGPALFRDLLNTARIAGRLELNNEGKTTYYSPDLGSLSFDIVTDSGKNVSVHLEKYSLKNLPDWGFVLDSNNLGAGQYVGLGPQWFMNLQNNNEIMKVKHAFFASWALNVFDDSTMGVVRGGTQSIVNR